MIDDLGRCSFLLSWFRARFTPTDMFHPSKPNAYEIYTNSSDFQLHSVIRR